MRLKAAIANDFSLQSLLRIYNSQTIAMVYVWTVDFDLQNDVSEGSHKLFRRGSKMLGACEESIGSTRRRVLYARCGAGTRFLYQNVVVGRAVGRRNGPLPTARGIFHITRRTVRRPFKATLIADIRNARGRTRIKMGRKE